MMKRTRQRTAFKLFNKLILSLLSVTFMSLATYAAEEESKTPYTEPATPHPTLMEIGVSETPAPIGIVREAYDIRPYEGFSIKDLLDLMNEHARASDNLELNFNNQVDEHWIISSNVFQALILRNEMASGYLITAFMGLRHGIRASADDPYGTGLYPPIVPNPLFYYWKQAAWVHPVDAKALAHALRNGYKGRVPINLEWADYWDQRADLLRHSTRWYKPEETSSAHEDTRFDINNLYDFIKQQYF